MLSSVFTFAGKSLDTIKKMIKNYFNFEKGENYGS